MIKNRLLFRPFCLRVVKRNRNLQEMQQVRHSVNGFRNPFLLFTLALTFFYKKDFVHTAEL